MYYLRAVMTPVFSELGRRMETYGEGESALSARNIAADMLSREALSEWLALYPALPVREARSVLIVMAGNIPFVGVHDLVCVLSAGHRAIVKPSSKDLYNMAWVVEQLLDISPELPLSLAENIDYKPDAVIAMGGDDAVRAIYEKYSGMPMLLRGHRSSLAVLTGSESAEELAGLADDILLYSGLGCRNVSLVWVPRGYDFAPLSEVLTARVESLGEKYRGNLRQIRAMMRMNGTPHIDCGASLLVEVRDFPAQPSILHYAFYDNPSEVTAWTTAHEGEIQCIATNSPYPRAVRLGQTQHPRLTDYPDGRDTMKFLETI
jgi:hypothetical protein